jgi:NADH-quinone oxidoreductase subunit N
VSSVLSKEVFLATSPILVVVLGGVLLMIAESFSKRPKDEDDGTEGPSSELALGSAITLFAGAIFAGAVWMYDPERLGVAKTLAPYLVMDRFTLFFCMVIGLGGGLAALLAGGYLPEHKLDRGEFYPLMIFSAAGAMVLVAASDITSIFLGLEAMSLGVYCLTGFRRGSARSVEASVKYFLLGSFAAALMIYGGALLYGATGHTDLVGIRDGIVAIARRAAESSAAGGPSGSLGIVIVGMVLMIVGLVFKVGAVPFHMWTPDAYEGAPTPATAFMAAAVKAGAFGILLRVLLVAFGDPGSRSWAAGWPPVIATLAILSMTIANLIAGRQESVKRMLAYSSIAQAGYVLVGVAATVRESTDGQASVLFYLLGYTVSTVGAFGALAWCGSRGAEAVSYEDLAGLGKRNPLVAAVFSLFLLSLVGVPPTAGFFGKLYIAKAAIGADLYLLAILLMVNSVIAAYYYLRVMVYMYMRDPAPGAPIAKPMRSGYIAFALLLAGTLVLAFGLFPARPLSWAVLAASSF